MMNEHPVDRAQEFWLAQPTEAFRLGAGDLAKRVRRLEADARNRRVQLYVSAFFSVTMWAGMFFVFPDWRVRVGTVMALCGWIYVIYQVTSHSRRTIQACLEMAEMPVTPFIREGLERERSFFSGSRFWFRWVALVAGPVAFCLGVAISESDGVVLGLLMAVAWIAISALAIPYARTKIREIQKQLDELHPYERAPR